MRKTTVHYTDITDYKVVNGCLLGGIEMFKVCSSIQITILMLLVELQASLAVLEESVTQLWWPGKEIT